MRTTALATALVFALATVRPAAAGECYVDSDCPTGMVCNSAGGCVVPYASNGNGNGNGSHASGTRMVIYAVILGVVIVALLVPAMRATDEASGVRARLDEALHRPASSDPMPATCNLTLRF